MIDFRNLNTLWASILVETLHRLGLTTAIACPGSRCTPLTVAFAQHPELEVIPVLDERSAAFFALGIAKKNSLPVALFCTSGTAGANFYPAVIEAKYSQIPLLILTADRPPELRNCHAGQTIEQLRLYGNYPNWQTELALPSQDMGMVRYLRQTMIQAWERSLFPIAGPVHLNLPFRDPLAPTFDNSAMLPSKLQLENFFSEIPPNYQLPIINYQLPLPLQKWRSCQRGMIIAGVASPQNPRQYCQAIAQLSQFLQWPVLAEGLSPLRNYADLNPYLIATYDLILRHRKIRQQLAPEMVIQIGEIPTSKELRSWLDLIQSQRWIISEIPDNLDFLHGKSIHIHSSIEQLIPKLPKSSPEVKSKIRSDYLQQWCNLEIQVREAVKETMNSINFLLEGKAAWLLSQILPAETPFFIANSMPIRNVEFFWMPNNLGVIPYVNRGANGIDGTLSTALGIAHGNCNSVMLTGDLSILHDTNGFLINNKFRGSLTIILINNNGGGIFEMLPISEFDPPFEDFFATPQQIDFAKLCATYDMEYKLIKNWHHFQQALNPLPQPGIRVLELPTNRKDDALWLKQNLDKFL